MLARVSPFATDENAQVLTNNIQIQRAIAILIVIQPGKFDFSLNVQPLQHLAQ